MRAAALRRRLLAPLLAPLFAALLFVASLPRARADEFFFVRDAADLYGHFAVHKANTIELAIELWHMYPERYGRVPLRDLVRMMSGHDRAKLDSSPEFQAEYWPASAHGKAPFLERLAPFFGRGYAFLNASEEGRSAVAELNLADKKVTTKFLIDNGYADASGVPNELGLLLLEIEKIADVVDRNANPVAYEEFGLLRFTLELMQAPDFWEQLDRAAAPLGRFLTRQVAGTTDQLEPDPELVARATALRARWRPVVGGTIFPPHGGRHNCAVAQAIYRTEMAATLAQ